MLGRRCEQAADVSLHCGQTGEDCAGVGGHAAIGAKVVKLKQCTFVDKVKCKHHHNSDYRFVFLKIGTAPVEYMYEYLMHQLRAGSCSHFVNEIMQNKTLQCTVRLCTFYLQMSTNTQKKIREEN